MIAIIKLKSKGSFKHTKGLIGFIQRQEYRSVLNEYGKKGVEILQSVTPVDTGKTRDSWYYETKIEKDRLIIRWNNSNLSDGVPVVVLLQFGHATKQGHWIEGHDFVEPKAKQMFRELSDEVWEKVTKA